MIIAVDHLALSSTDFDADCAKLLSRGFTKRFVEYGVRNPAIKRALVHTFMPTHDIGYFEAPGSLSVEVINQGAHEVPRTPEFEPLWEHDRLRGFVSRVSNLQKSLELWQALGFVLGESSTKEARLHFVSPLLKRLPTELHLLSEPDRVVASLDTSGWGAPAVMSTHPHHEWEALKRAGFEATPLDTITVDGQELMLFFVFAEGVPPVEVIGVTR